MRQNRLSAVFALHSDEIVGLGIFSTLSTYSGHGVARRLINTLINKLRDAGYHKFGLTAQTDNYASWGLYCKLGFSIAINVVEMSGLLSADCPHSTNTDHIIAEMTASDISECDQLHQAAIGHSRSRWLNQMLNRQVYGPTTCAITVRDRQSHQLLGYSCDLMLAWGHTCYTDTSVFQSMYMHACKRHATLPAGSDPTTVLVPHQFADELQWLLQYGVRIQNQLSVMLLGCRLPVQDRVRYMPSGAY